MAVPPLPAMAADKPMRCVDLRLRRSRAAGRAPPSQAYAACSKFPLSSPIAFRGGGVAQGSAERGNHVARLLRLEACGLEVGPAQSPELFVEGRPRGLVPGAHQRPAVIGAGGLPLAANQAVLMPQDGQFGGRRRGLAHLVTGPRCAARGARPDVIRRQPTAKASRSRALSLFMVDHPGRSRKLRAEVLGHLLGDARDGIAQDTGIERVRHALVHADAVRLAIRGEHRPGAQEQLEQLRQLIETYNGAFPSSIPQDAALLHVRAAQAIVRESENKGALARWVLPPLLFLSGAFAEGDIGVYAEKAIEALTILLSA